MSKAAAWKATERAVARWVGGKRTGHLGGQDVDAGWLSVECKHKREMPKWIQKALVQSRRLAKPEQLAVVVIHGHGTPHSEDLVVIQMSDFVEWFGGGHDTPCDVA